MFNVPFGKYSKFFEYITSNCAQSEITCVNWSCILTKKKLCQHSQLNWEVLHDLIMQQNINDNVTVQMASFQKEEYMTKYGKKEKAKSEAANIYFILNFLNSILPKIIYHYNYLHHFSNCIAELEEILKHFASIEY